MREMKRASDVSMLLEEDPYSTGFLTLGDIYGLRGMSGIVTLENKATKETITGEEENVWEIAFGRGGEWTLIDRHEEVPAAAAPAPATTAAAAPAAEKPSFWEKLLTPELVTGLLSPAAKTPAPTVPPLLPPQPVKAGMSPAMINTLIIAASILGVGGIIWALVRTKKD